MSTVSPSASILFSDLDVGVETDAPIGSMTWYGIGGRADLLIRPHTVEALETLCRRARRSGVPVRVLGSGANLLVADEGVDGIVLRLDHDAFRTLQYEPTPDGMLLRAMAGADLARTLMDAARRGLAGLEALAGIPASIGGAVRMNAGGRFGAIGGVVESVACLNRQGDRVVYPASELRFDYRSTNIPDPIIVSATLRLQESDPIALRRRVKEIFEFKKASQPLAEHSAGCSFKNPLDPVTEERVSAGRLIDAAGLKGLSIGGAAISRQHANFIVVDPGATAGDVRALMQHVRKRVLEHSGFELEAEVVIWERTEDSA